MANYVLNRTGQQISDILDGAYSANGILKSNGSGNITAQAVDSTPTSASTNLITSGAVASALNGKQDTLSNASLLSTYTQTEANLASAVSLKHSHSNKSVLDGISSSDVSSWDAKQDALTNTDAEIQTAVADAHTHSNKAILDTIPSTGTTGYVLTKTSSGTTWSAGGGGGGGGSWGTISGDITDQTDLQNEFNTKQDVITDLATIRSGASDGTTALAMATNKVLRFTGVTVSATTGDIATVSDSAITADHVLVRCRFASPRFLRTDVTWTTSAGSLVLNGTCSTATTAEIVLIKKDN